MSGELAEILRFWRDRLAPARAGLPVGSDRRTPGLRREELAVLAGVSVDYVVRLEQGRASAPSAPVCVALARALQLSDAEQAHLLRLAGHAVGGGRINRLVPSSVRRLLDRLDEHPIAVCDAMWTLITWNRMWTALMGDPSTFVGADRNVLWRYFTGRSTRSVLSASEREEFASSMVADLRLTAGRYPDDPELKALIARLCEVSEDFRAHWREHQVGSHQRATKTVEHPEVGRIDLDCDVLTTQHGDLRMVVYTAAPGSTAESKLALLGAIGAQTAV